MSKKISLSKDKLIVFMGTMNAMPMMYALELIDRGYDVIYFVDVPKDDILSRPENHFPSISYPYPSWIVEIILPRKTLLPLFPRLFAALYQRKIARLVEKDIGCFVLNGFFSSLAPYLNKCSNKVSLSHGSDLNAWAYAKGVDVLGQTSRNESISKYLPNSMSRLLIEKIVKAQYFGYTRSDSVVYFPEKFSKEGDEVIRTLVEKGVQYVPRYDISFEPLRGQSRKFRDPSKRLEIFSGVRFLFETFSEGNVGYNKGLNQFSLRGKEKVNAQWQQYSLVHNIES